MHHKLIRALHRYWCPSSPPSGRCKSPSLSSKQPSQRFANILLDLMTLSLKSSIAWRTTELDVTIWSSKTPWIGTGVRLRKASSRTSKSACVIEISSSIRLLGGYVDIQFAHGVDQLPSALSWGSGPNSYRVPVSPEPQRLRWWQIHPPI